eukprot:gene2277-8043_t
MVWRDVGKWPAVFSGSCYNLLIVNSTINVHLHGLCITHPSAAASAERMYEYNASKLRQNCPKDDL